MILDTTDSHGDARSHVSLGSVCTNHPRSTDIHPCSGSSVGKDQGNKVVAVERVRSCQVMLKEWQGKEREARGDHHPAG